MFWRRMGRGPRTNQLDFGGDTVRNRIHKFFIAQRRSAADKSLSRLSRTFSFIGRDSVDDSRTQT